MQLQLGEYAFDVTTRSMVIASVAAVDLAGQRLATLVAQRPAGIEIIDAAVETLAMAISQVADVFAGPIVARTSDAEIARQALSCGAAAVHDPDGLADPGYLLAVEESGGSVIIACPAGTEAPVTFLIERARWALAAGIDEARVVLHAPAAAVEVLAGCGYRVMVTSPNDASAQGFNTIMVSRGARLVASNDVQATRRTIDTVSELIKRREPVPLEPAGVS